MQDYPHTYKVTSKGGTTGNVELTSPGLDPIQTAPPPEFGGPEGVWSPETLFAASVSDCFILSFRAVTQAKKYVWLDLECETDAILERVDRVTRFTKLNLRAKLTVPAGADREMAERLLKRAKDICLVTNSMTAEKTLEFDIIEG